MIHLTPKLCMLLIRFLSLVSLALLVGHFPRVSAESRIGGKGFRLAKCAHDGPTQQLGFYYMYSVSEINLFFQWKGLTYEVKPWKKDLVQTQVTFLAPILKCKAPHFRTINVTIETFNVVTFQTSRDSKVIKLGKGIDACTICVTEHPTIAPTMFPTISTSAPTTPTTLRPLIPPTTSPLRIITMSPTPQPTLQPIDPPTFPPTCSCPGGAFNFVSKIKRNALCMAWVNAGVYLADCGAAGDRDKWIFCRVGIRKYYIMNVRGCGLLVSQKAESYRPWVTYDYYNYWNVWEFDANGQIKMFAYINGAFSDPGFFLTFDSSLDKVFISSDPNLGGASSIWDLPSGLPYP